jgi:Holliday junction resolvasome RuvABC endonuclease subunit
MPSDPGQFANLMGMDPGTNTFGLAWITVDVVTLEIASTQTLTLVADKMRPDPWYAQINCDRHARLQVLSRNISDVLKYVQPSCVVTESPFFNAKRPNAYQALVETIEMIRQTVYCYDWHMPLSYIDPPSVKRAVGAAGNAKKEEVQARVLRIAELNYQGSVPLEEVDEHSIDAIAAVYSKLIEFRRNRQ